MGGLFVLQATTIPVVLLALHAQVHQNIGKLRRIGDRRKGLNETSQTITFN